MKEYPKYDHYGCLSEYAPCAECEAIHQRKRLVANLNSAWAALNELVHKCNKVTTCISCGKNIASENHTNTCLVEHAANLLNSLKEEYEDG